VTILCHGLFRNLTSMSTNNNQQHFVVLQPPAQVAWRALCLGGLVFRAALERSEQGELSDQISAANERSIRNLTYWLVRQRVIDQQSNVERQQFRTMLGDWSGESVLAGFWRVEALGSLLWALGRLDEIPDYDTLFSLEAALEQIPLFEPVAAFVNSAALRPATEISRARDIAEVWHWRARITQMKRDSLPPPGSEDYDDLIQRAAAVLQEEGIATPIDSDLPLYGRAYNNLTLSEHTRAQNIAHERHFALSWLCSISADWDATRTDT